MLEQTAQLATVVQAVVLTVSAFLLIRQLRQATELTKAANAQALVEHAIAFTTLVVQRRELGALWLNRRASQTESRRLISLDDNLPLDKESLVAVYRELLFQLLIFHENIFYQYRKGLLDQAIYESWISDLVHTLEVHDLSVVSSDIQTVFPGDYGRHLLEMCQAQKNNA